MVDTGFSVPEADTADWPSRWRSIRRAARPKAARVSAPPANDFGGAGAVSTARDYALFAQMLANGGELDGARILSPTTVRLMASDHRAGDPGAGDPGRAAARHGRLTFGLGFAVREDQGVAAVPGSAGEFMWAGLWRAPTSGSIRSRSWSAS